MDLPNVSSLRRTTPNRTLRLYGTVMLKMNNTSATNVSPMIAQELDSCFVAALQNDSSQEKETHRLEILDFREDLPLGKLDEGVRVLLGLLDAGEDELRAGGLLLEGESLLLNLVHGAGRALDAVVDRGRGSLDRAPEDLDRRRHFFLAV
jgi:hypothetical protein